MKGARQQEVLAEIDLEIDNARAAWEWALEQEQVEWLEQSLDGLCSYYYHHRGRLRDKDDVCRATSGVIQKLVLDEGAPSLDISLLSVGRVLQLHVRVVAWQILHRGHRTSNVSNLVRQNLALLQRPELTGQDTRRAQAELLHAAATNYWKSDPGKARELESRSVDLFRSLGENASYDTAIGLNDLALAAWLAGVHGEEPAQAFAEAWRLAQESLDLSQKVSNPRATGLALMNLGIIALCQARRTQGEALVRRAIATLKETTSPLSMEANVDAYCEKPAEMAEFSVARLLYEELLGAYEEMGNRQILSRVRFRLGETEFYDGHYKEARTHFQMALALALETGDRMDVENAFLGVGMVDVAQGRYVEAQRQLQRSIDLCRENENYLPQWIDEKAAFLVYTALGLGLPSEAEKHMRVALRSAADIPHWLSIASALPGMALLLISRGEVERAVELHGLGSRYPLLAKAQFFEDIAWRHVKAAAADLPAEVVAAAQERGRARDLYETAAEFLAELGGQVEA